MSWRDVMMLLVLGAALAAAIGFGYWAASLLAR
jgi:hypothetical protein